MSNLRRHPDEREPGQYPQPVNLITTEQAVNNCALKKLDAEIHATRSTLLRLTMCGKHVDKPTQPHND